jgi:hypothetical protein
MIDVKQSVKLAFEYYNDLYKPEELHDLALEEVALSDDEQYWFVTLGFTRPPSKPTNALHAFAGSKPTRDYKIFKIHADNGRVLSMKIRKL